MNAHALFPSGRLNPGAKVWLVGPLGSGKTLAAKLFAYAASERLRAAGQPTVLIAEIDAGVRTRPVEYADADVLTLDAWSPQLLSEWVDYLQSDKTVIVTSIEDPALPDCLSDRINFGIVTRSGDTVEVMLEAPVASVRDPGYSDWRLLRVTFNICEAVHRLTMAGES